jgi:hypothetical protein
MSILPETSPAPRFGNFCLTTQLINAKMAVLDIRTNTGFINLSVAFESVQLVSAYAVLSFPPATPEGIAKGAHYILAFTRPHETPTDAILNAAATSCVTYADSNSHSVRLDLGENNFGKELKATILGNANPVLYGLARSTETGSKTEVGTLKLHFRASFHGSALG